MEEAEKKIGGIPVSGPQRMGWSSDGGGSELPGTITGGSSSVGLARMKEAAVSGLHEEKKKKVQATGYFGVDLVEETAHLLVGVRRPRSLEAVTVAIHRWAPRS